MSARARLYVGIAVPLVEAARRWLATLPPSATDVERSQKRRTFPYARIAA